MNPSYGEVAEWSIAADLKSAEPQGSGGSNPSLSASFEEDKRARGREDQRGMRTLGFGEGRKAEQAMPLALGRQVCSEAQPIPPSPPLLRAVLCEVFFSFLGQRDAASLGVIVHLFGEERISGDDIAIAGGRGRDTFLEVIVSEVKWN